MRVHVVSLMPAAMQEVQCTASQLGMQPHLPTQFRLFLISRPHRCEHLHRLRWLLG